MALNRRGRLWWTHFYVGGQRYRKPTGTSNKNKAKRIEHDLIEAARQGSLLVSRTQPKRLEAAVHAYIADKRTRRAPRTVELEGERLSIVQQYLGDARLTAITPDAIRRFQQNRQEGKAPAHAKDPDRQPSKVSNRTINMDVSALLRVLDFCGHLRALKNNLNNIHPLPETESDIGRALSVKEWDRLLKTAQAKPEWEHVYCAAVVAAHTSMCSVEVRRVRRRDVDLFNKEVWVPYGKNKHRLRRLPLMPPAIKALGRMLERMDQLGFTSPDHYLWCACKWNHFDPTKPQSRWDTAWHALRDEANLPGLRFHDLRHTIITELAETTTPDTVIQSIAGHVSKRMLDRYSHIRLAAKRKALELVEEAREQARRDNEANVESDSVQ